MSQKPAWKFYPNYGWVLTKSPEKVPSSKAKDEPVRENPEVATIEKKSEDFPNQEKVESEQGSKSDLIEELVKKSIFGNIYKNDYFWTLNQDGSKEVLKARDFDLEVRSEICYKEVEITEEPKPEQSQEQAVQKDV